MTIPLLPNDRWSLDFVSDQLLDGCRFCIRAVVDDCTRECLTLVADTSLSGVRVARELDGLITERGRPRTVVSDERHRADFQRHPHRADERRVGWHYIAPGSRSRTPLLKTSTAGCVTSS